MATGKVAKRYDRMAWLYDFLEPGAFADIRPELLGDLNGDVLEVGVGTGANLPYYPHGVRLTAIDISPKMLARAARKARDARMDAVMRVMDVEDLAFPDAAFDCVVSTLVFCSVEDPMRGLNQIRRVLRDGGELRMLEHVRSQRPRMGKVMDMLNPIANLIGDNINRRTVESVQAAGFELLSVEPRHAEILLEIRARRR